MTVGLQKFRKVSIIIVSLNTKYFFLKTVNSVLAQSYKEREIIVVDGNSTDGTIDIIKKMKKKFSKVIIEKDRGIYDAMNKGSRLVSGEWVIFLNSGDVFYNKNTLSDIFKQSITKKDIIYGNTLVKNKNS